MPVEAIDSETASAKENPNILVIDDDRVLLELLGKVFEKLGFKVVLSAGGKDAVDLVRKTVPDVVLLDVKMPGMDGITVLKEIKAQDPDIEVIIMTGFATLETAMEALKNGAFDYIRKPFESLNQVVDAIRRGWERRKPRLEKRNLRVSLERTIYELKMLYKISRIMGDCSDHKEMAVLLLDSLYQMISYDLAILMFMENSEPKEMLLQVINPCSLDYVEQAKGNLIDALNLTAQSTISSQRVFDRISGEENIVSSDSTEGKNKSGRSVAQRLNSFLNVPLMKDGNLMGMIHLSSHRDQSFSPDDIRLIYLVASQIPSTIQRLEGIKATEQRRMDMLAESMSDGIIMIDENFEVALTNPIARRILDTEQPDLETIQNVLGLDLKNLKEQSDKGGSDFVTEQRRIFSEDYQVTTSTIKGTEGTFMGFVICLRESSIKGSSPI